MTLTLEVDKTYVDDTGYKVRIVDQVEDVNFPFIGDNGFTYREDGTWYANKDTLGSRNLVQAISGGTKHDQDKPRIDLLDPSFLEGIAMVLGGGAQKYGDYNWQEGFEWSRLYGATQRHLNKFWKGEDIDPEFGESHLLHAATNLMFLYWHTKHLRTRDDRHFAKGETHNA